MLTPLDMLQLLGNLQGENSSRDDYLTLRIERHTVMQEALEHSISPNLSFHVYNLKKLNYKESTLKSISMTYTAVRDLVCSLLLTIMVIRALHAYVYKLYCRQCKHMYLPYYMCLNHHTTAINEKRLVVVLLLLLHVLFLCYCCVCCCCAQNYCPSCTRHVLACVLPIDSWCYIW